MKKSDLLSTADLCVKCGLCLPHCPTYQLTLDENESPRGRIALIQGWASGHLKLNANLLNHLDGCLLCRSCENICPAQVPYGRLLDESREKIGRRRLSWGALKSRTVNWMLRGKTTNRLLRKILRLAQDSFVKVALTRPLAAKLMEKIGLRPVLPNIKQSQIREKFYPGLGLNHGTVGLFIGCTGELADSETIDSAIQVLTRLGYNVVIPEQQRCCGALDLHSGEMKAAQSLIRSNLTAFDDNRFEAVIAFATGCCAMLKEYEDYCEEHDEGKVFSSKVKDISEFVIDNRYFEQLSLSPLNGKVYVHTPCSLKNVLGRHRAPIELLRNLAGIELIEQPEYISCCGAAGSYMIEHPQVSKSIREPLIESIITELPDFVVSSNVGCALHLRGGLREKGSKTEVLHPVTLVSRKLKRG